MNEPAPRIAEPRRLACARCGTEFECGSTIGACWCAAEEFRLPMPPADEAEDCLCVACLRAAAAARLPPPRGGSAR